MNFKSVLIGSPGTRML